MKHACAFLLAIILFTVGTGILSSRAEYIGGTDMVEIQQSLVSSGNTETGSLGSNLIQLLVMVQNEDVRSLLTIQDFTDVMNEIVLRVIVWLYENRPVTMEIFAELGAESRDIRCIEKIWDCLDRIVQAKNEYNGIDEGAKLIQEIQDLAQDQEFNDNLIRIIDLGSVENVSKFFEDMLKGISNASPSGDGNEWIVQLASERNMKTDSFAGSVIIRAISLILANPEANEIMKQIISNEKLWILLADLAKDRGKLDSVLFEEIRNLLNDKEIIDFAKRITTGAVMEAKKLQEAQEKEGAEQ